MKKIKIPGFRIIIHQGYYFIAKVGLFSSQSKIKFRNYIHDLSSGPQLLSLLTWISNFRPWTVSFLQKLSQDLQRFLFQTADLNLGDSENQRHFRLGQFLKEAQLN